MTVQTRKAPPKLLLILAGGLLLLSPLAAKIVMAQPADMPPEHPMPFQRLNLSAAQKTQMRAIRRQIFAQVQAVLSDDQKNQLKTALQAGEDMRSAMDSLNLTADQKTKIHDIMRSSKSQFDAVLTPEQRQQLQPSRRDGRPASPPSPPATN